MKDYSHLLNRSEHVFPEGKLNAELTGKRVLITGAGGSIGSALARRIYASGATFLGLVGHSEAPLFNIAQTLPSHPSRLGYKIADVGDGEAMMVLIEDWAPDVILHCAAHKHVGLMENQPREAFRNNCEATLTLAAVASWSTSVRKFVFISTDKAVAPTCVMGASKRLAEAALLSRHAPFATVCRFGNVLGSAGSVVEILERCIAEKITFRLTDPKMRRYFITAKEAVGLVLSAALLEEQGSLFTLDMGMPVLLMDIVEKMTSRSPVDIQIVGGGSGEKKIEALYNESETPSPASTSGVIQIGYAASNKIEGALSRVRQWPNSIVREASEL